jgi:hypothetical protein
LGALVATQIVLGAVGALQRRKPHARGSHDAQHEHHEPNCPSGPPSSRADHHDGTIGAPAIGCNIECGSGMPRSRRGETHGRELALISDVRANLPALRTVLADFAGRNIGAVYHLGDLVG